MEHGACLRNWNIPVNFSHRQTTLCTDCVGSCLVRLITGSLFRCPLLHFTGMLFRLLRHAKTYNRQLEQCTHAFLLPTWAYIYMTFFTWIWLVKIITKVIKEIIMSSTIKTKVWMFALACQLHYHLLKLPKAIIVISECTFNIWTPSTISRHLNPFW